MKITVRRQLVGIIGLAVLGIVVLAAVAGDSLRAVQVNGAHDREIAEHRELLVELESGAGSPVGAYLLAHQLVEAGEAEERAGLERRLGRLRAALEARQAQRVGALSAAPLRENMIRLAYRPALDFLDRVDRELVPALPEQRERARALLRGPLRAHYERNVESLERATAMVRAEIQRREREVDGLAGRRAFLMAGIAILIGLALLGSGVFLIRGLASAIDELLVLSKQMAAGDLTGKLFVDRRDELGDLAAATNTMSDSFNLVISHLTRRSAMLANASGELSSVSDQMSAAAEETSGQASMVSASAEQVTRNMQTVAVSVEEMEASIQEISKSTGGAAGIASQAAVEAEAANATVRQLGASSNEIGDVVKVIRSIADQTNLLALNAAIEAARAGEAGKGFAVVASEVKELARETALATGDIGQKIEAIQRNTNAAVTAIARIGERVHEIKDLTNTIASAIDEQLATTAEIGRNLNEAASGSTEISQGVLAVAQAAKETAAGSISTQAAAAELARMATELRQLTARFRLAPDAAPREGGPAATAAPRLPAGGPRFTRAERRVRAGRGGSPGGQSDDINGDGADGGRSAA